MTSRTPNPTNNEQMDELTQILDIIQARKWTDDDGREVLGTVGHEEAKAALQAYISQHYVPIGQASDEGLLDALDRIFEKMNEIIADHEGVDLDFYLKQSNYSMRKAKADIGVAVAQHTKEAVEAAMLRQRAYDERTIVREARIDELQRLYTRRHYGKDYQESLDELDEYKYQRLAELSAPQQSTSPDGVRNEL